MSLENLTNRKVAGAKKLGRELARLYSTGFTRP